MSKVGVGLLLFAVLVLTPVWAAGADFKIGVVDGMDIITKSAAGKAAEAGVKRKSEELGRPIDQKRQDLARQVEEFQKQASVMKEDARKRKAEDLEKKMQDFQKQGAAAEKQMQEYQQQQMMPLLKKLEEATKTVAQAEKLDLVIDKRTSGVTYMDPKLDITDKVRSRFGG